MVAVGTLAGCSNTGRPFQQSSASAAGPRCARLVRRALARLHRLRQARPVIVCICECAMKWINSLMPTWFGKEKCPCCYRAKVGANGACCPPLPRCQWVAISIEKLSFERWPRWLDSTAARQIWNLGSCLSQGPAGRDSRQRSTAGPNIEWQPCLTIDILIGCPSGLHSTQVCWRAWKSWV
jgi:hypothetical protein